MKVNMDIFVHPLTDESSEPLGNTGLNIWGEASIMCYLAACGSEDALMDTISCAVVSDRSVDAGQLFIQAKYYDNRAAARKLLNLVANGIEILAERKSQK